MGSSKCLCAQYVFAVWVFLGFVCSITPAYAKTGESAFPENPAILTGEMDKEASLEVMAGQMVMVGFRGTGEASQQGDLPDLLLSVQKGEVGGVVYFSRDVITKSGTRNIQSMEQIARLSALLQQNAPVPLFISVDQEGGRVSRISSALSGFVLPSAQTMGKDSPENVFLAGEQTGRMLASVGINLNFAPVADCNINPTSPAVGALERAFSADPNIVALYARHFAEGLAQGGVIACYKHFPGHGSATTDSHLGLTDITAAWSQDELAPYTPQNRPSIPMMMMPGHLFNANLDPKYPASLSYAVVTDLLRGTLGWEGVVVSDDLQMEALSRFYSQKEIIQLAINAGVDILLAGNNVAYKENLASSMHRDILALVAEGSVTKERIRESYTRIMALKKQAGLL